MINIADPQLDGNELAYVTAALQARTLSRGSYVEAFEREFARLTYTKHAIATNNGTTALHAALVALGVSKGDRVVVPATTYIATANAVRYCGAEPVFVDVLPTTWTINWAQALMAMHSGEDGAAGVIPVHLYGVPAFAPHQTLPMTGKTPFCLEDAAEAHGAIYKGCAIGSIGIAGVFSFYGNKILTTGEGGMVVTNDDSLAREVRHVVGVGQSSERYIHDILGYNYRMPELSGCIGLAQTERVWEMLAKREELGDQYRRNLHGKIEVQDQPPGSVDWVFPVMVVERDRVARDLFNNGIETRPVFPPLHRQPIYATKDQLPVAEALGRHGLLLPLHTGMTSNDVDYICERLLHLQGEHQ